MKTKITILSLLLSATTTLGLWAQDTVSYKGQLSTYIHFNGGNDLPLSAGARYIPQLNFGHRWEEKGLIDFELSANIYGNTALKPFTESEFSGRIKPYRAWARYSTDWFELRAGLQKINFGSASLLRPLMWFDRIDPRDPLKLTDGVWGLLGRYYLPNNANIWVWGLLGNNDTKGWEPFPTKKNVPEFGGRIQYPLPYGEAGLSYHHRVADLSTLPDSLFNFASRPENRIGIDAKFDMTIGWWIEASWSNYGHALGNYNNMETVNVGADYTFGIGNGLNMIFEQLVVSADKEPFQFGSVTTFSLLNLSYPMGFSDNIGAIVYYDWTNNAVYSFATWQKQFNNLSLYLMGYMNPKTYNIPAQGNGEMPYVGKGIQIMLVYNH